MMTHRQRIETAWALREPDRVPIELDIEPEARKHPKAERLLALMAEHVDSFVGAPGAHWGFLGFPTEYREETIEDVPGSHRRVCRTHVTPAGAFTAVTLHPAGESDYHWEKRFITTVEELRRLAETPRPPIRWDKGAWDKAVRDIGDNGVPFTGLLHPLGGLVRQATMEEVYGWFLEHGVLVHRYLAAANAQVAAAVEGMRRDGVGSVFMTWAHEMFIPPWTGHRFFDEFVFPYDKAVNDVIHRHGGRLRTHCHGRCGDFLEKMADMGSDAIEPLEHAPRGDVDLADAKRRVGSRVLLSGNVASELFTTAAVDEVRAEVRRAIRAAGPGGGFTLRTSGGDGGTWAPGSDERMVRALENSEAFVLAGLEYGQYPIR